jgi:hypothetical protein
MRIAGAIGGGSQAKSLFPALKNPANRHRAVEFSAEQFHYAFTNTLTEEESNEVWDRYAIGAPGFWVLDYGLFANFKPGHQDTWVDFSADRAPLLFITGGSDHIMPLSVNKSNAKQYRKSPAITDYFEFEGRDLWTCGAPGWEAVADYALDWALKNSSVKRVSRVCVMTTLELTPHRGAHAADRVRRLAHPHRSDFRSPRPELPLRLGDVLDEACWAGFVSRRSASHRRRSAESRSSRRLPR